MGLYPKSKFLAATKNPCAEKPHTDRKTSGGRLVVFEQLHHFLAQGEADVHVGLGVATVVAARAPGPPNDVASPATLETL